MVFVRTLRTDRILDPFFQRREREVTRRNEIAIFLGYLFLAHAVLVSGSRLRSRFVYFALLSYCSFHFAPHKSALVALFSFFSLCLSFMLTPVRRSVSLIANISCSRVAGACRASSGSSNPVLLPSLFLVCFSGCCVDLSTVLSRRLSRFVFGSFFVLPFP